MLREAYLSSEYTAEDKELIALFQKQLIDDHLNQASSLLRLKTKKNLSAFYMERITQLGPVHTEAVKALLDNSKMLVSASLSSSEKVAMNMINKYQQAQVRLKLAE